VNVCVQVYPNISARNQGSGGQRKIREISKSRVGAIHEAAVLFGCSLQIKNRQDIAPTLDFETVTILIKSIILGD
jgi:hypothetical protein